jgi:hypothetical protein
VHGLIIYVTTSSLWIGLKEQRRWIVHMGILRRSQREEQMNSHTREKAELDCSTAAVDVFR